MISFPLIHGSHLSPAPFSVTSARRWSAPHGKQRLFISDKLKKNRLAGKSNQPACGEERAMFNLTRSCKSNHLQVSACHHEQNSVIHRGDFLRITRYQDQLCQNLKSGKVTLVGRAGAGTYANLLACKNYRYCVPYARSLNAQASGSERTSTVHSLISDFLQSLGCQ